MAEIATGKNATMYANPNNANGVSASDGPHAKMLTSAKNNREIAI
jgi:hypothetical protein